MVRPLDRVYPVIFIDALVVKIRDGQVTNRPIYVVVGVTVNGERDILGLWAGDGGEGAKFWLSVFTELRNRGVEDVCIAVCDGLKGIGDSITTAWPFATVQTCILHLIRNTFRYASKADWEKLAKPVYTAVNAFVLGAAVQGHVRRVDQRRHDPLLHHRRQSRPADQPQDGAEPLDDRPNVLRVSLCRTWPSPVTNGYHDRR